MKENEKIIIKNKWKTRSKKWKAKRNKDKEWMKKKWRQSD